MKLGLIAPEIPGRSNRKKALLPPLGLAMVAAVTPPDVEITLTDENVAAINFQQHFDLVGITALTITARRAYEIADTYRTSGVKVVLGGMHPSVLPEEAGLHADAIVIGEAEGVWPTLIEDFNANKLKSVYRQSERPNLVGLPLPRRDLFAKKGYQFRNTLSTTRGCPYSCAFCTVTSFFGHTYRTRPVYEICREIESLGKVNFIVFLDDNIVGNPRFAKELFRALIPYKIKWVSQSSVTIAKDEELMQLAADSGCLSLFIGFESISPTSLAAVGKNINVVENYEDVIKRIHDHGIGIHGFFIFGFDDEEESVFERTVRFAQKTRLETAQFDYLTPYPGTAFGDSMDKAGRILSKDWTRYGYEMVYEPKSMTIEAMKTGHDRAWRWFYSITAICRRLGVKHRHLWAFWVANMVFRANLHNGRRIGSRNSK
jgi:radical SAM superfamily enzyme YgiQ (UPF0313 family)